MSRVYTLTNFLVVSKRVVHSLTPHPATVGASRLISRLMQLGKVFNFHKLYFRGVGVMYAFGLLESVLQHIGGQIVKILLLVQRLFGLLFRFVVDLLNQVLVVLVHVRFFVVLDALPKLFRIVFRDVRLTIGGEDFGWGVCNGELRCV
jgi:hypothetical protein